MTGARRQDVESIDAIITALYETISGPAGPRDWDRLRSLFVPAGRMVPARPLEDHGSATEYLDLESFITSRSSYFDKNPLYEIETDQRVERFGSIAQVWSTYDGYHTLEEAPFFRGANSLQLLHDGDRWWIVSVLCCNQFESSS